MEIMTFKNYIQELYEITIKMKFFPSKMSKRDKAIIKQFKRVTREVFKARSQD